MLSKFILAPLKTHMHIFNMSINMQGLNKSHLKSVCVWGEGGGGDNWMDRQRQRQILILLDYRHGEHEKRSRTFCPLKMTLFV